MRVPVADIVQVAREHSVDLGLLAPAVWLEESASALILRFWASRQAHNDPRPLDPGEELTAGLAMPEVKLAVPIEIIEDAGLELNHIA